jgi:NTE family protein
LPEVHDRSASGRNQSLTLPTLDDATTSDREENRYWSASRLCDHAGDLMSPTPTPPDPGSRALVLGGGGSSGNAWLVGVVAGLLDAGLGVTDADVIVGTSAGSTTAVQLTSADPAALYAAVADTTPGPAGSGRGRRDVASAADHLERMRAVIAASTDVIDLRRSLGAAAIERAAANPSARERWRATVAARLPSPTWPERRLLVTAVDADTAEPVVFDRDSGVDLVDAVAASCSSWLAYEIGARRYIDGGYRSNADNADLAAGCERVLVLSPLGGRSLHPPEWGTHLATQVDALRMGGSRVETVFPDSSAEHLFGANVVDLSLRANAARAGHDQGVALAERITELWR